MSVKPKDRSPAAPPHDRFLDLEGTLNTRDLGGLPLRGGGYTLHGKLFRSDGPIGLTAADVEALLALPLSTVIDLRQGHELEREPSRLLDRPGVDVRNIEVWSHIDANGERPADKYDITAFYLAAIDHAGSAFANAVTVLAEAEGAALFHCTAGKDRTGLLAALMLEAVGVDRDTVIADFALTHDRIGPLRERLLADAERNGVARTDFQRLLGATPELMVPALDHLDARHGGAAAYLRRAGVSDAAMTSLRTKLAG
ncbi:MAG TPA: tyrosine-protein phosphatase [Trueperaceae bacterium]|nr:tyrosine-protein phosphatase [Trueperaceae bacterium]